MKATEALINAIDIMQSRSKTYGSAKINQVRIAAGLTCLFSYQSQTMRLVLQWSKSNSAESRKVQDTLIPTKTPSLI